MTIRRVLVLLPALLSLVVIAPAASASPTTFADTAGTSHEAAVTALADRDIVRGCESDRFCAGDQITRGQAAAMLVRALELPEAQEGRFRDTSGTTHARSIDSLADAGLIRGCGEGAFCPQDPISREQLASMLQRAFDVPAASEGVTFFDDLGSTHGPSVGALAAAGIANGCGKPSTAFCGGDSVQRSHAAMFLARGLELVDPVELPPFEQRQTQQRQEAEQAATVTTAAPADTPASVAVAVARAQLGKPYRWGGSGPHAFDCSGLTSFAWAQAGVDLPRTSRDQYRATTRISRDQLRPGDLVFYHSPISHVAMYIGNGRVVEAPNSSHPVRIREDGLTRRGVVGYGRP